MDENKKKILEGLIALLGESDNPDSIEIGTPGKGGTVKIYGNFADPEGFKRKVDAAADVREYAGKKSGAV